MKRILTFLPAVAATILLAFAVSCKNDKGPANSSEMDAFITEAPYLNHLPDDPDMLITFHVLQLLDKSGFATDEAFADLRNQLLEGMEPATRVAALGILRDPSLAGLDPAHPIVIALDNITVAGEDATVDLYGVLPLSNRDLLIKLANQADAGLTADEDGNYRINQYNMAAAILPDAVVFFASNSGLTEKEIAARRDAMVAKSSVYVGGPLAESVLMAGDDLALLATEKVSAMLKQAVDQKLGRDIAQLLGGNPFDGIATTLRLNCLKGKLVADVHTEGSNALLNRMKGWIGTPDKKALACLPAPLTVAGQVALNNVPDILDFVQGVLDRSGEADGIVIGDLLASFGIKPEDLKDLGTICFGYNPVTYSSGDFIVVADAGEKLVDTLEGLITGVGMTNDPQTGYYQLTDNYCVAFKDGYAQLASWGMTRASGSFPRDCSRLAGVLSGSSIVMDLAGLQVPSFDYGLLTLGLTDCRFDAYTTEPGDNAAKTLLTLVIDYLNGMVSMFEADPDPYDFDAGFGPDFDEDFDEDFYDPDFD